MLGRFVNSILTLPWYWRVFLPAGLALVIGALLVLSLPTTPTMRAIESVGGEVVDSGNATTAEKVVLKLQKLFGVQTRKYLFLGPRDRSRIPTMQVYNERLTDEEILQIDLSEIGPLDVADLSGPHVTDRGFCHIAGNKLVSVVICHNAQVTDAGLEVSPTFAWST